VDINGTQSDFDVLRLTSGDDTYRSCYAAHFSSSALAAQPVREADWARHRGLMLGIFRAPAARIAAGFVHNFASCPTMRREYGPRCDPTARAFSAGDCAAARAPSPANVRRYFACVRGCAVNVLNGIHCGGASPTCVSASASLIDTVPAVCDNHVPTAGEVAAAVARVTDGDFAVVGLAEQYGESVRRLQAVLSRVHVVSAVGGAAAIRTDPIYQAHLERAAAAAASLGGPVATTGGGAADSKGLPRIEVKEELAPLVPHGLGIDAVREAERVVAGMLREYRLFDLEDAALYAAASAAFDAVSVTTRAASESEAVVVAEGSTPAGEEREGPATAEAKTKEGSPVSAYDGISAEEDEREQKSRTAAVTFSTLLLRQT
jgi:hypothetical protein